MNLPRVLTMWSATAALVCVGCKGNPEVADASAAAANLLETRWRIVSIDGEDVIPGDATREPHMILQTKDNVYVGSTGLNQFFGAYETSGDSSLTLRAGGMTMMAGPEPMMKQEQRVLERLGQVDGYRLEGQQLTLRAQGRDLMVLRAEH